MDSEVINEILEELSSAMQRVEAQSAAVLELVQKKGIATQEELAPYLERASASSSVRWTATRARLGRLLEGLEQRQRQENAKGSPEPKGSVHDETETRTAKPETEMSGPNSSEARKPQEASQPLNKADGHQEGEPGRPNQDPGEVSSSAASKPAA